MLREMQREINMGRPCESRLHIDYSTDSHHSQLRSADDLDCCFMAILSWKTHQDQELCENTGAIRVSLRTAQKRNKLRTALTPRLLKSCSEKQLGRAIQIQKILAIQ